jgi:hypothetical protein
MHLNAVGRRLPGLILAVYLLLAAAYSLITPPWEAPDEPSHYLYAEHLAAYGALPPATPQPPAVHYWEGGYVTSPYEWHQPPLYYALVAPQIALANLLRPGTIPQAFPPVNPAFPTEARNLFAALPDPAYAAPGWRLARWFSVALGLATLWATYRAATAASGGDRAVALTATGMMAFIPQFTFLNGYVTNDTLALLLSALCLWSFVRLLGMEGMGALWPVAGAGGLVALALYTKLSLLVLLPLGLFCLLLRLARHRSAGRWLRESAVLAGVAILPYLLGLVALPELRDRAVYAYVALQPKAEHASWAYLAGLWPQTYTSFWGWFGWMNVGTPRWIAHALNGITAVGLIGSLVLLLRGRRGAQAPALGPALSLLWAACGLAAAGFLCFNLAVRQPQGRLLFAALPALVILVALGIRQLAGRRTPVAGAALVLFALVANLICLFGALLPAYGPPV